MQRSVFLRGGGGGRASGGCSLRGRGGGVLREEAACNCDIVGVDGSFDGPALPGYQRIAAFLQQLGFRSTRSDASLFVYRHGTDTTYLLLYVDDIILTACTDGLLR